MSKKYRLQTVMNARERAKQEQARVVGMRREQLAEAERELARREEEVVLCRRRQAEAHEALFDSARQGAEAARLTERRAHIADLRRLEQELIAAALQQRDVVARRERELEAALEALREASKDFQAIERHRERWQEEQRRDLTRREQKMGDEIAAILREQRRGREE